MNQLIHFPVQIILYLNIDSKIQDCNPFLQLDALLSRPLHQLEIGSFPTSSDFDFPTRAVSTN